MTGAAVENIVTIIVTAILVLGLYWMGAGGWSFLGLLVLANMNQTTARS
jgi:hypothetical protein